MVTLQTPLTRVIAAHPAKQLAAHRHLTTVGDLLWFLPRRYLDRRTDLGSLRRGDPVAFYAEVVSASIRPMRQRRGRMLTANVRTTAGQEIELTFFSAYGHESRLKPGRNGVFAGQVGRYGDKWQLAHPAYEIFGEPGLHVASTMDDAAVFPIYLEVPKLPSFTLTRLVEQVLMMVEPPPDPVPAEVRARRGLPDFLQAMRLIHCPVGHGDHRLGRRALKYDEAFVLQSALARRRAQQAGAVAVPRRRSPEGLLAEFDGRLPFDLTHGQLQVSGEIFDDLASERPMNRLLQGEVGSGKTIVALRAMLAVIDAGGQAALLAPTEVLAAQHFRSITTMLGDLAEGGLLGGAAQGTRVALLTGSQSTAARKEALLAAACGQAGIVVGTHALIQEKVQFADLALAVIDEQHRFGVEQRDLLRTKARADRRPHVLVMTATPIPRTVAMTVFGDMETSVLREVPAGRSPIATHVVDNPRWYARAWDRVAEEVAKGHQAFVVAARIGTSDETGDAEEMADGDHADGALEEGQDGAATYGESDSDPESDSYSDSDSASQSNAVSDPGPDLRLVGGTDVDPSEEGPVPGGQARPLRGAVEVLAELSETTALVGLRLGLLHGRLPAEEKDAVMQAFAKGEIDVLVSTTVVEVGVDVPNATAMVILDADRFGVSQLHQLRGRVGRGGAPGLCLLVTGSEVPAARERLQAVAETTDGFALSQLDLLQRREGDVLGARQAGVRSSLRILRIRTDEVVIVEAREDAVAVIARDPMLEAHPELAEATQELLDPERAAFLERG